MDRGAEKILLGDPYHTVKKVTNPDKLRAKIVTWYRTPWDKYFSVGYLGAAYGLWTLGMLLWHLFRFANVDGSLDGAFFNTLVTSSTELAVVGVAFIVLSVLSFDVTRNRSILRRLAAHYVNEKKVEYAENGKLYSESTGLIGHLTYVDDRINIERFQTVVSADYDVFMGFLAPVVVEVGFVGALYTGVIDAAAFTARKEMLFLALVIKCFAVLKQLGQRAATVRSNMRRLKLEHVKDAGRSKINDEEMVQYSSPASSKIL